MMKKKSIIILVLIILILIALVSSYIIYSGNRVVGYIYYQDGERGELRAKEKNKLIKHIKQTKDARIRKEQIDFAIEQNILTQEEGNKLY